MERELGGIRLEEEIERIDGHRIGRQIDRHRELGGRFRKNQARLKVGLRVLLPSEVMVGGTTCRQYP